MKLYIFITIFVIIEAHTCIVNEGKEGSGTR